MKVSDIKLSDYRANFKDTSCGVLELVYSIDGTYYLYKNRRGKDVDYRLRDLVLTAIFNETQPKYKRLKTRKHFDLKCVPIGTPAVDLNLPCAPEEEIKLTKKRKEKLLSEVMSTIDTHLHRFYYLGDESFVDNIIEDFRSGIELDTSERDHYLTSCGLSILVWEIYEKQLMRVDKPLAYEIRLLRLSLIQETCRIERNLFQSLRYL